MNTKRESFSKFLRSIFGWIIRNLEFFAILICAEFLLKINTSSKEFILTLFIVGICSGISTSAWIRKSKKDNG